MTKKTKMEMHQIKYFLSVTEEKHISRAAEKCHVSQPSLSRAIKKLEEELGSALFQRKPGRVNLTKFGQHVLPFLKNSYDQAMSAKKEAKCFLGVQDKLLRVGLVSSVYHNGIVVAFEKTASVLNGLDLRLQQGSAHTLMDLLHANEIDITIGTFPVTEKPETLEVNFLYRENYIACFPAGHAFSTHDAVSVDDVLHQPLLMFAVPPEIEAKIAPQYNNGQNGARPLRVNLFSACVAKAMLNQGITCAIAPEFSQAHSGLECRPIHGQNFHRDVYVMMHSEKASNSAAHVLARHLRESCWK